MKLKTVLALFNVVRDATTPPIPTAEAKHHQDPERRILMQRDGRGQGRLHRNAGTSEADARS